MLKLRTLGGNVRVAAEWIGSRLTMVAALAVILGGVKEIARSHPAVAAQPPLTIGFIYVGPKSDYGYNQAHAQGAAALAKMPGVKIREEEMVPETIAVQK